VTEYVDLTEYTYRLDPDFDITLSLVARVLLREGNYILAATEGAWYALYPDNTYVSAQELGNLLAGAADHPIVADMAETIAKLPVIDKIRLAIARPAPVLQRSYASPEDLVNALRNSSLPEFEECECADPNKTPIAPVVVPGPIVNALIAVGPGAPVVPWRCADDPDSRAIRIGKRCYRLPPTPPLTAR